VCFWTRLKAGIRGNLTVFLEYRKNVDKSVVWSSFCHFFWNFLRFLQFKFFWMAKVGLICALKWGTNRMRFDWIWQLIEETSFLLLLLNLPVCVVQMNFLQPFKTVTFSRLSAFKRRINCFELSDSCVKYESFFYFI
jgi:hypothetical protein